MKRLTCFSKRDFGGIVLAGVGVAELVVAFLLFLSLKINETTLMYGLSVCTAVFGLGYFCAYIANARSRVRPCWYLPIGILLAGIGVFPFVAKMLSVALPGVSLSAVVICICVFNAVISLSNSFQLKSLCLSRWFAVAFFSAVNFCYGVFVYLNLFDLRTENNICIAVFLIIIAVQTLFEPFYIFGKESISGKKTRE